MRYDICIIGGAGHVGLPLGVVFANAGHRTALFDVNQAALASIAKGKFPFREKNGNRELAAALRRGTLSIAEGPEAISQSRFVALVIGTPVDEYLNPDIHGIRKVIDRYLAHFHHGQILLLRSTVYPGTSERVQRYFIEHGKRVTVAFCPERIAQGRAFEEIRSLPQIISAFDRKTLQATSVLFDSVASRVVQAAHPVEAELAKLFSNSWRYIKFAVANQFFTIADDHELDYQRIYTTMTDGYPRNADLPRPGFAAGPCLLKDTMQLAAFHGNNFFLGHAAMMVNEGLPNYLVQKLRRRIRSAPPASAGRLVARVASMNPLENIAREFRSRADLKSKTIGILGMAFKGDSDDGRDSLAYKLRKVAQAECRRVLATDVYIKDPTLLPLATVLKESDILILAAPHREYRAINPAKYPRKEFVDIWNFWPRASDAV